MVCHLKRTYNYCNTKWLNYNPLENDSCKKCKLLPICFGGCPAYSIKSGHPNCSFIKYNIDNFIEIIQLREKVINQKYKRMENIDNESINV